MEKRRAHGLLFKSENAENQQLYESAVTMTNNTLTAHSEEKRHMSVFQSKSPVVITLSALVLVATTSARDTHGRKFGNCNRQLEKAITKYEKGRYSDVRIILDEFKYQCSGHPAMDSALFYLGMAMLNGKQQELAKVEFERLLQDFPRSPFAEEAHFRIGCASYHGAPIAQRDQNLTEQAIREFRSFLERRPDSKFADSAWYYIEKSRQKLAKKRFMNARFYEKLEHDEAAVVYYKSLISEYPNSSLIPEAKVLLAKALVRLSRPTEAKAIIQGLLDDTPSDEVARDARLVLARLEGRRKPEKPAAARNAVSEQSDAASSAEKGDTLTETTRDQSEADANADAESQGTEAGKGVAHGRDSDVTATANTEDAAGNGDDAGLESGSGETQDSAAPKAGAGSQSDDAQQTFEKDSDSSESSAAAQEPVQSDESASNALSQKSPPITDAASRDAQSDTLGVAHDAAVVEDTDGPGETADEPVSDNPANQPEKQPAASSAGQ